VSLSTTIKTLQDIMRKDAGVDGDAQRIGQLGWLLFFKIYSDLELEAQIEDPGYVSPIPAGLHWGEWADQDVLGKDAPTGDALLDLVENQLFAAFKNLDLDTLSGKTRDRGALLRGVFEDAFNYMKNGTLLRQVINKLNNDIDFNQSKTRHLFGDIYEQILKDLQGAGNAGEFYTPRAATQFAVEMVNPQLGETILDPACGTGGFLAHAYEHLKAQAKTPDDLDLAKDSVHGVEKKSLPHLLCVTNMMIHGIEVPTNVRHDNTLARPLRDYGKKDQVDVIVTNPPFGGMEEDGIESNFPSEFRTRETADLFLVLVMELLKDGGRAAVVLPDGTLFGDGIKARIKEKLLRECDLHTIVRLPKGVFAPYTSIKTNILFFTKGKPTKEIWYYEHPYPEGYKSYSKTKPMRIEEFEPEKAWWGTRAASEAAWHVPVEDVVADSFNLDISNPALAPENLAPPQEALNVHSQAVAKVADHVETLREILASTGPQAHTLVQNLHLVVKAPGGLDLLRGLILDLAVEGRLLPSSGTPSSDLVAEMRSTKESLVAQGIVRPPRKFVGEPLEGHSYPPNWTATHLGDVALILMGNSPPGSSYNDTGEGVPLINGPVEFSSGPFGETVKTKFTTAPKHMCKEGDLLVCVRGATTGRTNIAAFDACIGRGVALVRGWSAQPFINLFMWKVGEKLLAAGKGTTFPSISYAVLSWLRIRVPPHDDQEALVERVHELVSLCRAIELGTEETERTGAGYARSAVADYASLRSD